MKILINKITPWPPTLVRLQWELRDVNKSGAFGFGVERSGSPSGPWDVVTSSLTDVYTYDDTLSTPGQGRETNTLSLVRDIYYRVYVLPPGGSPGDEIYSPVVNLDGLVETKMAESEAGNYARPIPQGQFEPGPTTALTREPQEQDEFAEVNVRHRLIKRKLIRDFYLQLKNLNGVNFSLLKRRHFGERCSCYDTLSREILNSHCDDCYATSWVGGFFTPIHILGRIVRGSTGHINTELTQHQKDDVNFPQIQVLDFPRIDEGDVLVDRYHNRRFIVQSRYNTSLKMIIVHQTLTVSELPRTAVEYQIPADVV